MSKPRKEIDKERMEQLMVGHRKVFVRYNEGAAIYATVCGKVKKEE